MENINIDIKGILKQSLNIYHYGSFVYETFNKSQSDYDYIVIMPDAFNNLDKKQFENNNNQYSFYTKSTWQKKLDNNDVDAMEIYFLPPKCIVKETVYFHTYIVPEKIRNNFSRVSSNSFVKCKKKLEVKDSFNPRIAKKSLWHSLRIVDFGIQILSKGKIENYQNLNYLYDEIVNAKTNDWKYFKEKYQPIYNSLKSQFRLFDRKEIER
jgi:hypothetical protein